MTTLVTGATGFIGGHVTRALLKVGHEVRALVRPGQSVNMAYPNLSVVEGDLRDRAAVAAAVRGCHTVFQVAALYAFWLPEPQVIYDTNVGGTRNVLEAAAEAGVDRMVYTSTVGTVRFHANGTLASEEEDPAPGDLEGHYKRSKFQAEREARYMATQGLPVIIVNPTAAVGLGDAKPTPTGQMILDFVRGRMPAYINTGLNIVDVEDVAAGHLLALKRGQPGRRYLLGNQNVTLREVFHMLARITGRRPPRLRLPYWVALAAGRIDHVVEGNLLRRAPRIPLEGVKQARKRMWVDCSRAVRELGMPQTAIEEALEKAVRWFRDNGYVSNHR